MMRTALLLLAGCLLLTGCQKQQQPMYYMGNYSESLYTFRKVHTEAQEAKHVQTLENIIEESEKRGRMVPPGIFIERGYKHLGEGRVDLAKRCFASENRLYPESRVLTNRLLASVGADDGNEAKPNQDKVVSAEEAMAEPVAAAKDGKVEHIAVEAPHAQ